MIFCTPKDKVTHCVREILNDWDGNGDKNSADGDTAGGDGDRYNGMVGDGDEFLSLCSPLIFVAFIRFPASIASYSPRE